jgi:hypothetical protein
VVNAPKPPASRYEREYDVVLDRGAVAQRLVALAPGAQLGDDVVLALVQGDEVVDRGLGGRGHRLRQLVDAPGVDLHAEGELGLGLVALGDGDEAHVVAEAGELQRAHRGGAGRGAGPRADLLLHARVADVADDGLAGGAEARLHVAELAVAVRGLVEVHEVEVDLGPGQLDVRLRVQVQQRLAEGVDAADPHLGGTEGVHPRGDADDGVVEVRLEHRALDRLGVGEDGLPDELDGDVRGGRELVADGPGLLGDLAQGLLAVEALAAGEEPDLLRGEEGRGVDGVGVGHASAPEGFWP